MKRFGPLALLCAVVLAPASRAWGLDLDDYLGQVRRGNAALRGGRAQDAALALSAKQPLTAFSPQFAAQVQHQDDQELPAGASLLSPSDTQATTWDANLSKFFSTGTQVGLDYSGDETDFAFPPAVNALLAADTEYAGFLPALDSYGQQAAISVSQSLWRNFMAAGVDASLDKAAADADAARAANLYQAQAVLYQARQAYVDLETDRLVRAIAEQSLKRDREILDWTRRKYDDNLADEADVLDSRAALGQASFDLASSREDEAKAGMVFNTLRGLPAERPVENLDPVEAPAALPPSNPKRRDLLAAEAALRSSEAQVRTVTQSFTPDLSVFADLGQAERTPAAEEGFRPDTLVGLKFSANLDFLLYRQVLAGARQAEGYGAAAVEDKRLEIARDWAELRADFAGVRERLELAREIEDLQRRKADRENALYLDGRTTHFQVLRAQGDYDAARIQTLRLADRACGLEAQARYYNGDDQPW